MKKLAAGAAAAMTIALGATAYAQNSWPLGYMIAKYEITDQEIYQRYMEAAGPLAPKYNGRIIVFNLNSTGTEGNPRSVMAIAEFPSLADAERFYNSPEYSEAKKLRIASTEGTVVITEGFVPPQQ
jgi:uncharacterized protein (DUF1330 family)